MAERPISSKCYAASLRLVAGLRCEYGTLLESARMVMSRRALFSGASVRVWYCADGCQQTSMSLPSRPFTRVAEQRRDETCTTWTTLTSHALIRRLGPRANAAPSRHLLQPHLAPTRRRRGTAATCAHVDVPCRAGLAAVCTAANIHMSPRCSLVLQSRGGGGGGAALIALTRNCHELGDNDNA